MPKLQLRNPTEVPPRTNASRAVQEQQRLYEGFINQLNGNVGELELAADEQTRAVKVRLRRAATRLNKAIEIWDANGKVYFKVEGQRGRGRPRKAS